MGESELRTDQPERPTDRPEPHGRAAPAPSTPPATRHTFILRLIPTFRDDPTKPPGWYGELEHYTRGNRDKSPPERDVENLLRKLATAARRIVG